MSKKNNLQFSVGAYWIKDYTKHRLFLGVSLWKIVYKHRNGDIELEKIQILKPSRKDTIYTGESLGLTKKYTSKELNEYAAWSYVENINTIKVLFGSYV